MIPDFHQRKGASAMLGVAAGGHGLFGLYGSDEEPEEGESDAGPVLHEAAAAVPPEHGGVGA